MAYVVDNRLNISIYFDGVEYPTDSVNVVQWISVTQRIGTVLPTCHVGILDVMGVLTLRKMIYDAAAVRITVQALGSSATSVYNFRIFQHKTRPSMAGAMWEFDGYLDNQEYWLQVTNKPLNGTSQQVISQVAQTCGLQFKGDTTGDQMLWIPGNKTYGEFVSYIAQRGYVNTGSCMVQGVTLDGILVYKDFNTLGDPIRNIGFGSLTTGVLPITDFHVHSNSGFHNKISGYTSERHVPSGMVDQSVVDNTTFKSDSRVPNINLDTRTTMNRGAQAYAPLDFGNVHSKFEDAYYQNIRLAGLYNMTIDMLSIFRTGLNIFDVVNVTLPNPATGEQDQQTSGALKLIACTQYIQGTNYYELLTGVRHGMNDQQPLQ